MNIFLLHVFLNNTSWQDCSIQVQQLGADFILSEGFDIIFSLITEYHKAATIDMKQHGFSVMMRSMENLVQKLASVLNSAGGILVRPTVRIDSVSLTFTWCQETDERISHLNCLKMNLYLFCQLVRRIILTILLTFSTTRRLN